MARGALAQLGSRGVLNPCQEMLCGAADFITAHWNPTTMKPLELGPEPTELGNVTDLTLMGTNSTVCGLSTSPKVI